MKLSRFRGHRIVSFGRARDCAQTDSHSFTHGLFKSQLGFAMAAIRECLQRVNSGLLTPQEFVPSVVGLAADAALRIAPNSPLFCVFQEISSSRHDGTLQPAVEVIGINQMPHEPLLEPIEPACALL